MTMKSVTLASPEHGRRMHGGLLYSVLATLLFILFLEALDNTIVGPALPHIVAQFRGFDRYSWVATAYLLTSTIMIPLAGKFSDQFGRKWFLLAGASIFLLGSALTGASQSMNQLIAFRALQGLGAGIGITLVATIIGDIFPPDERAKWQTSVNIVYAAANLLGPGLGGWFTDHGPLLGSLVTNSTRWRWIFYINLPLGIVAIITLIIILPATISERSNALTGWNALRRIDVIGAFSSAVATICLLLGLTWGSNEVYAWNSVQVIGVLMTAVLFILLFLLVEQRAVEPLLPLNLFRNQIFAADALLSLLVYMILLGLAIYLPFFLQEVLKVSATNAGLAMTPFLMSVTIGATLAGWLIARRKRYQAIIIVGTVIMTLGVFFLTRIISSTNLLETIIFMVVAGLGIGSIFSVLYVAAQNVLPLSQLGIGSAVVRYTGQIGSTLGIAIVGTVVNQSLRVSLTIALRRGFLTVLVFCGAALLAACLLKDVSRES